MIQTSTAVTAVKKGLSYLQYRLNPSTDNIPGLLLSALLLLLLHGHIAQAHRQVAGLNGCEAPEHETYAEEVLR